RAAHKPAGDMNNAREHFDLGEALGMMDFERAAKVSGARFVYLKSGLARLNRALASFMLDSHTTKFGYEEVVPPFLVRHGAMFGTGQLPKFFDDLFVTVPGENYNDIRDQLEGGEEIFGVDEYFLVPTAEVPLTNYVNGEIVGEAELPIRFTAYTPCF